MFKTRFAMLGVLALFIASGIATSTASAAGPFWHVNGSQLGQGKTRQIKLQSKGPLVLKSAVTGGTIEIECQNSISEGATIEGSNTTQGQDKGRVTYTQCKVLKPEKCKVVEPITTNQLKSYLAFANTQTTIVDVFQPTVGKVFVELKLVECGLLTGGHKVEGAAAAEVIPANVEGQEGLIVFPSEAIHNIKHEGQEPTIELKVDGFAAGTFSGVYAARLATFPEKFGVFKE